MNERAPYRFVVLAVATFVSGVVALLLSESQMPVHWSWMLFVLALATLVAENTAVVLPRGVTTSLSFSLAIATSVLLGPTASGVVNLCSVISFDDLRSHVSPTVLLFNVGQVLFSHVAAGWLYLTLGGRILMLPGVAPAPLAYADLPAMILPLAVLAVSAFALNALFVTIGFSVKYGTNAVDVWRQHLAWVFPLQMALSVVGVFIAQVMSIEAGGFVLFVFPLLVSRQVYTHYVRLERGYLDTVRSLVGALEAKDPYTRGHSERVAQYAAAIADSMGMSEEKTEQITLAAQLHDLGKVGLSNGILRKPGGLTSEEYFEVRNHPEIGAEIVARVPTLAWLAPIVRHHHERYDGAGYVAGLSGNEIPLEARVLAMADSFDAMTSSRAYRPAMSIEEAAQEILSCEGSQFDPLVVEHLRAMILVASKIRSRQ
ncbi:MAG: HD-GYP domain-containing protein [Coriobacteriia bacterium]|nr:HD-GYP domain-containing protein [Coriobacteriia bacterium]